MRNYYAYTRVSTVKQGEKGSSLTEQKDAISRYATKANMPISAWFEEQETGLLPVWCEVVLVFWTGC